MAFITTAGLTLRLWFYQLSQASISVSNISSSGHATS
jgi:hypothetical protein